MSPLTETDYAYRLMLPADLLGVSELVWRTFDAFVAPDYTLEGVEAFWQYVQPEALRQRLQSRHFGLICRVNEQLVGVIEVRDYQQITLLFVAKEWQRRGIARELLRRAVQTCRARRPMQTEVKVHSSPYAVPIFKRLGFRPLGPRQSEKGMVYVPMALKLAEYVD